MRTAFFRISVRTLACICVLAYFSSAAFPQRSDEYEIFELLNRERSRSRLRQLAWDDDLAQVARNYSRQMAREGFFSHHDSRGRSVVDRAEKIGWAKIGENLFMCTATEDLAALSVRGWLRSVTHRRNMLDREWTDTGIGVYRSRDDRIYVTQVFISR